MNRYAISLFLMMSFAASSVTAEALRNQNRQTNPSVSGSWNLTLLRGASPPRTIKLTQVGSAIKGAYVTKDGKEKIISSGRVGNGYVYFRVAELSLFFEMRFVGTRLEGTMTDYSSKIKKPAEPVRMVKVNTAARSRS